MQIESTLLYKANSLCQASNLLRRFPCKVFSNALDIFIRSFSLTSNGGHKVFNKTMLKRMPVVGLALAALMLLTTPAAQAMKLNSQNLAQLINESQSIIQGTVKSVSDGVADNGMPYTEVTIAVGSAAKGNIKESSNYTFRQFGLLKPRKMANGKTLLAVSPEGFPRWNQGETVVAFMYTPASKTGLQTTAGMAQGKLTMNNGMLTNEFNNAGMFDGVEINSALLTSEQQNMLTTPGAVNAAQFMDLVGRAVSENWIANGDMK
jgi:hypothetical protein